MRNFLLKFTGIIVYSIVLGCASKNEVRQPQSVMDTPKHHILRANDLIAENRWGSARREIRLAHEISPEHPLVLSMQALIVAQESTLAGKSTAEKQVLISESQDLLNRALSDTSDDREHIQVLVNAIHTQIFLKSDPDWYESAKDYLSDAQKVIEENTQLYPLIASLEYYMGMAHESAFEFDKALASYRAVTRQRGALLQKSSRAIERVEKILRANPTTDRGNHIATLNSLTRADMAALLVEEFQLSKLKQFQVPKKTDAYQVPESQKKFKLSKEMLSAFDIADHPLQNDIEEVIKYGIRGMQPDPRQLFYPNEIVTRAEYAMILEDILISLTNDESLASRFVGEQSPWHDVRSDAFYYNAARVLVSRGMMFLKDKITAKFSPEEPISGAEALLGLRTLSHEIRYTR